MDDYEIFFWSVVQRMSDVGTPAPNSSPPQDKADLLAVIGNEASRIYDESEPEEFDLGYAARALTALILPVVITMFVTALLVYNLVDPTSISKRSNPLNNYLIYKEPDTSQPGQTSYSNAVQLQHAVVNAGGLVGGILASTFLLVLLYYFRCITVIIVWLMFSVVMLFAGSGGFIIMKIVHRLQMNIDGITYCLFLYNFSIVGVISIFWKGPPTIKQFYLVAVSVIMAFILSLLPIWTNWTFVLALSLYDLCAVLTPCGPLKCLINLAMDRQEAVPALLYEASPAPSPRIRDEREVESAPATEMVAIDLRDGKGRKSKKDGEQKEVLLANDALDPPSSSSSKGGIGDRDGGVLPHTKKSKYLTKSDNQRKAEKLEKERRRNEREQVQANEAEAGFAALDNEEKKSEEVEHHSPGDAAAEDPSPPQFLRETDDGERSIRLGLGDFVIYSVIVSRAVQIDFATMIACTVAILCGLAGTLIILSLFRRALPALPFSVLLAVIYYFATRFLLMPFMDYINPLSIWI